MIASGGRRRWDSAAKGADSLGISGPSIAGSSSGRSLSSCAWWAFHEVVFYRCDRRQRGCAKDGTARVPGRDSPAKGEEHLRRHIHGPAELQRQRRGWAMCIRFRPNRFGRSFGRKLGVLYDDYAKDVSGSACAINKMKKDIVLHTQEVTGSSPVAPTIPNGTRP